MSDTHGAGGSYLITDDGVRQLVHRTKEKADAHEVEAAKEDAVKAVAKPANQDQQPAAPKK
ncbi:MAG TPA: hypothetical protein VEC06_08535 [Paucimonas sp.]|nr:hypothetical protein [Paucimonas sp.]